MVSARSRALQRTLARPVSVVLGSLEMLRATCGVLAVGLVCLSSGIVTAPSALAADGDSPPVENGAAAAVTSVDQPENVPRALGEGGVMLGNASAQPGLITDGDPGDDNGATSQWPCVVGSLKGHQLTVLLHLPISMLGNLGVLAQGLTPSDGPETASSPPEHLSSSLTVTGWIDFNQDGRFTSDERAVAIFTGSTAMSLKQSDTADVQLSWQVPVAAVAALPAVRMSIVTNANQNLGSPGVSASSWVQNYRLGVVDSSATAKAFGCVNQAGIADLTGKAAPEALSPGQKLPGSAPSATPSSGASGPVTAAPAPSAIARERLSAGPSSATEPTPASPSVNPDARSPRLFSPEAPAARAAMPGALDPSQSAPEHHEAPAASPSTGGVSTPSGSPAPKGSLGAPQPPVPTSAASPSSSPAPTSAPTPAPAPANPSGPVTADGIPSAPAGRAPSASEPESNSEPVPSDTGENNQVNGPVRPQAAQPTFATDFRWQSLQTPPTSTQTNTQPTEPRPARTPYAAPTLVPSAAPAATPAGPNMLVPGVPWAQATELSTPFDPSVTAPTAAANALMQSTLGMSTEPGPGSGVATQKSGSSIELPSGTQSENSGFGLISGSDLPDKPNNDRYRADSHATSSPSQTVVIPSTSATSAGLSIASTPNFGKYQPSEVATPNGDLRADSTVYSSSPLASQNTLVRGSLIVGTLVMLMFLVSDLALGGGGLIRLLKRR